MDKKTCYLFGAGEYDDKDFEAFKDSDGFIIAADGGYRWLESRGIRPELLVGDMDSLGFVPEGIETVRMAPEKDDTDMAIAINEGLKRGCDCFYIFGGLGGRLDHTVGNIQQIVRLSRMGIQASLISWRHSISAIHNGEIIFPPEYDGYLSVFAYGGTASGVYEKGLKYLLDDAVLRDDVPLGVSNEFTGSSAKVSVECGTLIIMWQQNLDKNLPEVYWN